MSEFLLFLLSVLILIPGVWLFTYRRGLQAGRGKPMSHVRGLVFSALAFSVFFIVFAVLVGGRSTAPAAGAAAPAPDAAAGRPGDTQGETTSDESYAKLARMYQDRHFDALENELDEHRVGALKIIPAMRGESNVAEVLKSHGIGIARNPDVSCLPFNKLAKAPGCMLTVYLTRRKAAQQTDLSGVPAHWFMGVDESRFRPLEGWAVHVDQNDAWLDAGGMFGVADNR